MNKVKKLRLLMSVFVVIIIFSLFGRINAYASSVEMVSDVDYDGIPDYVDDDPENAEIKGQFTGYFPIKDASYILDFREFFKNTNEYNPSISLASIVFANNIYKDSGFGYESITDLMKYHGFKNVIDYKLAEGCNIMDLEIPSYYDDYISEVAVGIHDVELDGSIKRVIGIVIRGTNGTVEEWSNNFEVGNTTENSPIWDKDFHKGFYLTAERIKGFVRYYCEAFVEASDDVIYWITGHSRGAALSNIVAARLIDEGKNVVAYTFATPSTTKSERREDEQYSSIFNIINKDDLVVYLPLAEWGYGLFGKSYVCSMSEMGLEEEWCEQTGQEVYGALDNTMIIAATERILKSLCSTQNEMYGFLGDQDIDESQLLTITERARRFCKIEDNIVLGKKRGYKLYPSTAFVLQVLAEMMTGQETFSLSELINSKYSAVIVLFFLRDVNWSELRDMRTSGKLNADMLGAGHAPATYYMLVRGLNEKVPILENM